MLEVRNLVFHPLDNGVEKSIIEDISFAVPDGEMLVITGPNGGGKSTMAKLLMELRSRMVDRFYWMDRILRNSRLRSVQKREFRVCIPAAAAL